MKALLKKVKKALGATEESIDGGLTDKSPLAGNSNMKSPVGRIIVKDSIPEPATIRGIRESIPKLASKEMTGRSVAGLPDRKFVSEPVPQPANKKIIRDAGLPPASRKRDEILRFIIHGLRAYTNEKNTGIKGIKLFILCAGREEENLVNVALYADRPNAFQQEVLERKFSDNYLAPDPNWHFEFSLVRDALPDCQVADASFGMNILKDVAASGKFTLAKITILSGQAEKADYVLDPTIKLKYKIGRGYNPALPSGMMHNNDIVFFNKEDARFDEIKGAANLTVSRYHASIVFNPQQNKYYIAADKGGTPDSGNKTKLFSENGKMTRLDIANALHVLSDGDQVELGGSARLVFEKM